jgi:hypothetical protein
MAKISNGDLISDIFPKKDRPFTPFSMQKAISKDFS